MTASVVAKSFDHLLGIFNPKTRSTSVPGEFGPGPFTVSADDSAGIFTLTLGTPFGEALASVAAGADTLIVCPKGLVPGASRDAVYGSGPYTLASEDRASGVTFKLRPDWNWGPNGKTLKGLPGTLVYKIITNDTTAANLLLTGGLDIARAQGPDVKRLLPNATIGTFKTSTFYTNPLGMNSEPGHVTADKAVREAIFYAVSSDAWVQAAYGGLGTPTSSLWATNAPCFAKETAQHGPKTVDLAKAKSILLTHGYSADSSGKLTKSGQPLNITVVGATDQGARPEYLASVARLSADPGIVDYSLAPRRLAWRTARAFASAWRRRSNTAGSVTLRRVRMLAAAVVVDRERRVGGELSSAD